MSVLSSVDRKWARLLRGDALARIIPPHAFTRDEWGRIVAEQIMPGLIAFARSQEIFRSEREAVEHAFFAEAMLPIYEAGLLQGGVIPQTFLNKDITAVAAAGTAYVVNSIAAVLDVKGWGGGGAGGSAGTTGGNGAGGGYVYAEINVIPGETLLLYVGGGGARSGSGAGGGGGYTGLFRSTTPLIIAGGGGGGGAGNSTVQGGAGGGGGGTNGESAQNDPTVYGTVDGGDGGTQSAGGAASAQGGTAGSSLQGGTGVTGVAGGAGGTNGGGTGNLGGGGGGGYFGGGGGGQINVGSGGGGGSGYVTGINTVLTGATRSDAPSNSFSTAANTGDADYAGNAGRGGRGFNTGVAASEAGNPGRLVIIW